MKRDFFPFAKSVFLALMTVSAYASAAQEPAAKPDASKGEALYVNGDSGRGIAACFACHGDKGNSTIAGNPKLAGQHAAYLSKQLLDFTKPERNQGIMTPIAKALTPADMANLGAYLSMQAAKPGNAKNKETLELGKKIYRAGIAEKNVPACAGCHSPTGAGMPAQYPRLAGQHFDYTAAQLSAFAATKGGRKNSAQMVTIAKRMSDDEMKAVADYVAGLK